MTQPPLQVARVPTHKATAPEHGEVPHRLGRIQRGALAQRAGLEDARGQREVAQDRREVIHLRGLGRSATILRRCATNRTTPAGTMRAMQSFLPSTNRWRL